jgi:hypothetical protein
MKKKSKNEILKSDDGISANKRLLTKVYFIDKFNKVRRRFVALYKSKFKVDYDGGLNDPLRC